MQPSFQNCWIFLNQEYSNVIMRWNNYCTLTYLEAELTAYIYLIVVKKKKDSVCFCWVQQQQNDALRTSILS